MSCSCWFWLICFITVKTVNEYTSMFNYRECWIYLGFVLQLNLDLKGYVVSWNRRFEFITVYNLLTLAFKPIFYWTINMIGSSSFEQSVMIYNCVTFDGFGNYEPVKYRWMLKNKMTTAASKRRYFIRVV